MVPITFFMFLKSKNEKLLNFKIFELIFFEILTSMLLFLILSYLL